MFSTLFVFFIAAGISALAGIAAYLAWRAKQTAIAAQREIHLLAEQRQLALTAANMGWWHFDPISNISTWDNRYAEIFGVEGSEANNDDILKLLHPDDLPAVLEAVGRALDPVHPKPYAISYRLRASSDGKGERWIEAHGMAEFSGEGPDRRAVSFAGTVRDVTDRTRAVAALRESESKYRLIADNTSDWIYWVAPDGSMRYTSPSCERITGWQPEDFENNRGLILTLVLEEDRPMVERHAREMHGSGASEMIEFRIRTREGETRWIEHACSAIRDGNGNYEGQRATNRDITDRKLAQEALLHETRRYAEELERRVAERTRQLEAANRELESFSYSVSHDLRAPLRAVDGYTRILLEDYGAQLDAEGQRICSVISDSAARLGMLIDDLLAFSRLGRVPMQSVLIDMEACARSVFMEVTSEDERPRIEFRLDPLPRACGDRAMLQQVWVNLLSNAVKFSSKSERPEIVVSASRSDGEMEYCVRDNGAGFDMQYADKLFGVFQRLHSVKEFPGTGVGLAIVQRIIARHGGRVRGVGQPGKGAEFFFTLPAGEPS